MVDLGRAPTAAEIAHESGTTVDEVRKGWRRLHDAHALVLNMNTDELRMLNPFSAVPTAYRVRASNRWWYANCAWDAFGILGALHLDGRIETSCPDCGGPIATDMHDGKPSEASLRFHCLLPARQWWNDIVFS